MGYRKQDFEIHEYYHLYNRGTEKRRIFLDKKDYEHFLYLMYVCNSTRSIKTRDLGDFFDREETIVNIGSYCLMPNHFHILVKEKVENGISLFMRKLLTAYVMYFNLKYKRTGRLFENTFKSSHVSNDRYLKYLYTYIHLNPAKLIDKGWKEKRTKKVSELLEFVFDYKYSSLLEYDKSVLEVKRKIINIEVFPKYFDKIEDHKNELFDWLTLNKYPTG
ncbi:MAG: transposase [Candidatus Nomurabacteria bacterium]|nr:transposase [Candidatus Nomurabacteria bacterium]